MIVNTALQFHVHSSWFHVAIDFVGPISPSSKSGDYFTKWVEAVALPTKEAPGVAMHIIPQGDPLILCAIACEQLLTVAYNAMISVSIIASSTCSNCIGPREYILLRRRGHATSITIEIFQCYYF